jgi:hypothetical protein
MRRRRPKANGPLRLPGEKRLDGFEDIPDLPVVLVKLRLKLSKTKRQLLVCR